MELKDYLRIIRRHVPLIVLTTGITVLCSFYVASRVPRIYRSEAEIIVQDPPMILIASEGRSRLPHDAQDMINSVTNVSLIKTREVLEYALYHHKGLAESPEMHITNPDQDIPLKELEEREALLLLPPVELDRTDTRFREGELRKIIAEKKGALTDRIALLKSWISVEKDRDSQIVRIIATHSNPEMAQLIAQAVVEGFLAYSEKTPVRRLRLQIARIQKEELAPRQGEVDKLEKQLAEARQALDLPAEPTGKAGDTLRLIERLMASQEALQQRKEALENGIADLRRDLLTGVTAADPAAEASTGAPRSTRLVDEMLGIQHQIDRQLGKWTAVHPEILRLHHELKKLQDTIDRTRDRERTQAQIQLKLSRHGRLTRDEQTLQALREKESKTARDLEDAKTRLRELGFAPPDARELVDRRKRVADAEGALQLAKSRRDAIVAYLDSLTLSQKTFTPLVQKVSEARPAVTVAATNPASWPMAAAVGLILGLGAAYFLEYISTKIRTEQDVRRYVNLPLLGMVLRIREADQRLLINVAPKSPLSEVFNTIGTIFESYGAEYGAKVFMVASSKAEEGKSTITANLAVAMARGGRRVILVDADLRKAVLHRFFSVDNTRGVAACLAEASRAEDALHPRLSPESFLQATDVEGLRVLPAGPHPQNPVGVVKSTAFKDLLARLREMADVVLIDVPPVNLAVDTMVLSSLVDAVVLLVSAGETDKDEVTYAKRIIEAARGKMIGCILNKVAAGSHGYYYYYYYYDSYKYYREP